MPSPVGHALGGLVFGWVAARRSHVASAASDRRSPGGLRGFLHAAWALARHPWTIGFALLGAAADADLLLGIHSRQSHSLGAIALVTILAAAWGGRFDLRRGLACGLAYGSHVLLDWMGSDATPPIGIMALWPLTSEFYQSELFVFDAIWRDCWRAGFWAHNLGAVLREVALLTPCAALVWWVRRLPSSGVRR